MLLSRPWLICPRHLIEVATKMQFRTYLTCMFLGGFWKSSFHTWLEDGWRWNSRKHGQHLDQCLEDFLRAVYWVCFLFIIVFTGACLRPMIPRPITDNTSISVKFIDDCTIGSAINLTKSLGEETDPIPQPVTYNQRTGHKLKPEENIMQYELDNFTKFASSHEFVINEKKTESMVFNFSEKYAFPPNLCVGDSCSLNEVSVTKLLGIKIQNDLKWQENTEYICKQAQRCSSPTAFQHVKGIFT